MIGPPEPIGIVAGSGALPLDAARAIVARGGRVHIAMVDDLADAALSAFPHTRINWAQVGRTMSAFKSAGVRDVIMLGATGRPTLRTGRPDWGFIKAMPTILGFLNAGGDDAVLRGLVALFEANGLSIKSPVELAPELLIGDGALTRLSPSARDAADVVVGFDLVAALGSFDIGQGAVIADGAIVAIEAAEGTDRMLKRVASMPGRGDGGRCGVLVKRPKPGQDMRVDLPTIGSNTVLHAADARLCGIAVMADSVLAAGRAQTIADADSRGIFIVGTRDAGNGRSDCPPPEAPSRQPQIFSKTRTVARDAAIVPRAAQIVRTIAPYGAATVVIVDRRVMAVGSGERAPHVIARASLVKHPKKRKGLAAVGDARDLDVATVRAAHAANLAGVLIGAPAAGTGIDAGALEEADRLGLFVVAA